jgi:hypothetical protein
MEKFSEACVIASTHTILLVQNAFDAGYLSRRNPAVIYFLFAAALVILANEFAGLYRVDASDTCILNAINIMNYCAESDQQASRLVYILSTFRDVVAQQRMRRKQNLGDNTHLPSISSQLYGVPMSNQAPTPTNTALGTDLANSTDPLTQSTRLHQVPIHIYPGMETGPLNSPTPTFQTPSNLAPHASLSQPPTDFSVHLSPIQDPLTNPLNTPSRPSSLSMMLDMSALEATRVPSLHSEDSGQDEQIDFDALWAWPSNTPAMSPRPGMEAGVLERVQGISDSVVPMFGVSREAGQD